MSVHYMSSSGASGISEVIQSIALWTSFARGSCEGGDAWSLDTNPCTPRFVPWTRTPMYTQYLIYPITLPYIHRFGENPYLQPTLIIIYVHLLYGAASTFIYLEYYIHIYKPSIRKLLDRHILNLCGISELDFIESNSHSAIVNRWLPLVRMSFKRIIKKKHLFSN